MLTVLLRSAVSAALIGVLLAVCLRLPDLEHGTVALLMVLAIVGIAAKWGRAEAFTAAIAGSLGFAYYFLLPAGVGVSSLADRVALAAFFLTAVVCGQLAARRNRAVAVQSETEKLSRMVNALLHIAADESQLPRLAHQLAEIFEVNGAAIYDTHTGKVYRSGAGSADISDVSLQKATSTGLQVQHSTSRVFVAPVKHGGEVVGSVGICGARLSESLVGAIADRVGLGLAKFYAIEKAAEAEAVRRADELKSAILDAMAHEMRNPLNSVKLAATTLLSGHVGSELHKREMLTIIEEEANRMDRFIDESVQVARLEARELTLNKEPQDLTRLIPAAVEDMGSTIRQRPLRMAIPTLPPTECDREMIARVVKQLLNNALKYSPAGAPLAISAERSGAAIVINVVDSGPGVAEDERERIFEKYYRGRASRSRTPGTGLGLSSAKSIVEAHGGKIWVTAAPGGGAAFHVSLPITTGGAIAAGNAVGVQ
jgi:two-component system sensor histidine kinase KdpD